MADVNNATPWQLPQPNQQHKQLKTTFVGVVLLSVEKLT
jgi:hypothetical protein